MSDDKIAEIRARHLRAGEEMASWLWDSPLTLYADRATLLAEVERLRQQDALLLQAVGLLTTLAPRMEINPDDPARMAQQVVAEVERMRGTSTPTINANVSRLASVLGVTLGHLHETGGRELECVLERLETAQAEVERLREALRKIASQRHYGEECWNIARKALENGR